MSCLVHIDDCKTTRKKKMFSMGVNRITFTEDCGRFAVNLTSFKHNGCLGSAQ